MTYQPPGPPPNYPPPYPSYPPPYRESWFKRNMLWFVPLVLCIIGSPFVCCGMVFFGAWRLVNQPIDAAFESVEADLRIIDQLGQPLERGSSLRFTDMQINENQGYTDVGFDISGPRGSATVDGRVRMNGDDWSAEYLEITFSDGTRLIVPEGAEKPDSFDKDWGDSSTIEDVFDDAIEETPDSNKTIQEILRDN